MVNVCNKIERGGVNPKPDIPKPNIIPFGQVVESQPNELEIAEINLTIFGYVPVGGLHKPPKDE